MPADVTPHEITLVVWDVPSPLAVGGCFKVKVGARCSEECQFTGQEIVIRDQMQVPVARGTVGPDPWFETAALYWADVNLIAPAAEGAYVWDVSFVPANLELPHETALSHFSFITVPPAEHNIKVRVVEKTTNTTVGDVEVRFGGYRCHVGESGLAEVELPKGHYDLLVYKLGYQALPRAVDVSADATVQIEIEPEPEAQNYWP
jgi:hypothetical protein